MNITVKATVRDSRVAYVPESTIRERITEAMQDLAREAGVSLETIEVFLNEAAPITDEAAQPAEPAAPSFEYERTDDDVEEDDFDEPDTEEPYEDADAPEPEKAQGPGPFAGGPFGLGFSLPLGDMLDGLVDILGGPTRTQPQPVIENHVHVHIHND